MMPDQFDVLMNALDAIQLFLAFIFAALFVIECSIVLKGFGKK